MEVRSIQALDRVLCSACRKNTTVTKIPEWFVPPVGASSPGYRCDACGYVSTVFWMNSKAYLGEGLPDDLTHLAQ